MIFQTTPSQTVGPYFAIGLPWAEGPHAVDPATPGAITITGTVYDGAGAADPRSPDRDLAGRSRRPLRRPVRPRRRLGARRAFAASRATACEAGDGELPDRHRQAGPREARPGGRLQAPHIDVTLFARGMLNRVVTRIYFADEEDANAADPVLAAGPRRPPRTR